jgi:single-stranded-DNA-specific exonuclease
MATQTESLKKTIVDLSTAAASFVSPKTYNSLIVETSADPVSASLLFSSFFMSQNRPFMVRFTDPFSERNTTFSVHGPKVFFGYTAFTGLPENEFSLEISHHSSWVAETGYSSRLNPNVYGLNGASVGSTSTLSLLLLREMNYNPEELLAAAVGGCLTTQPSLDAEQLGGLNRDVLENAVQGGHLTRTPSFKAPLAEGLDISFALSLMLDPYIPNVSGDQKGAHTLIQQLLKRKSITKSSGILAGEEARAVFDEVTKLRSQTGFKELQENNLLGYTFVDRNRPIDSPLRNVMGMALAFEACVNQRKYSLLSRLLLGNDPSVYPDIAQVMHDYSVQVSTGVKQILQTQEYVRETQNALYVFSPKSVTRNIALRVAKVVSQHSSSRSKPVILVVPTESKSYIAGTLTSSSELAVDLGKIFYATAERYKGLGFGSSIEAQALVSSQYVETFFDDIDIQMGER